jgi:D-alanyl-lipoteichoic acid acyltransferase DltB (MBOAT superfamily)
MGGIQLLVFCVAALVISAASRWKARTLRHPLLFLGSLLALYWLQPPMPIRHLDFWLPTTTLALATMVWAAIRLAGHPWQHGDLWTAAGMVGVIVIIGAGRYIAPVCCLTPTRPPELWMTSLVIVGLGVALAAITRLPGDKKILGGILLSLVLALFLVLKTETFTTAASAALRSLTGQQTSLASALDIRWLGFSYMAFRLIHALRDRATGRLPDISLLEFILFIAFFPTLAAGPIDRLQRFIQDLRAPFSARSGDIFAGGWLVIKGAFKKFVLADSLALIALNANHVNQVSSAGWMWILVYAYALRIYFDFSGYTDVALGLGRLVGFQLPDNFSAPYTRPNLTLFWNSWHITLAQWFRAYFFNPLTRALRSSQRPIPLPAIIFVGQVGTMLLIGLWHGVTWNFFAWGLWHGIGLFIHNRWQEYNRQHPPAVEPGQLRQRLVGVISTLATFHYVALGWVFFALPNLSSSGAVFRTLFGL